MKLSLISTAIAAITFVTGHDVAAQTFNMTRSIGNSFNFAMTGLGQVSNENYTGSPSLFETVTIDTGNNTIRQVGNLSLTTFTLPSMTFHATQNLPPVFPNPPVSLSGDLTLSFSFPATTLSFDTGFRPMSWDGSQYIFSAQATLNLPISFSYSLSTGGNTYSGTENSAISLNLQLGGAIGAASYPTSIELDPAKFLQANTALYNFVAPNGFEASALVTVPVPEPSTFALFSIACLSFVTLRCKMTP